MTKLTKQSEKNNINYVGLLAMVMPRNNNGHQASVSALAESLKRGNALLSQPNQVKGVASV
jgi:hypothetical protein